MARVAVSELTLKTTFDAEAPQRAKVGDVIHSMLTEAQFQAQRDSTWVLMDGRDLSETNPGSAYEALTGQSTLPNAKGRFLRGLDTSGTVDPDGVGRNLGSTQNDKTRRPRDANFTGSTNTTGNHYHIQGNYHQGTAPYGTTNIGGSNSRGDTDTRSDNNRYRTNTTGNHSHSATITGGGDAETRPTNIAVNIFIKINE